MSFEESKQCLLEATNHGMTQVVTDILDRYPNIDAIDEVKRTSLIIASSKGDVDTVAVLLARNASIDNRDNNGDTALSSFIMLGASLTTLLVLAPLFCLSVLSRDMIDLAVIVPVMALTVLAASTRS